MHVPNPYSGPKARTFHNSLTGRAYDKHTRNGEDSYYLFGKGNVFQTVTTDCVKAVKYINGVIDFDPDTDRFSDDA